MARVLVGKQTSGRQGTFAVGYTAGDATDHHYFINGQKTLLLVYNGSVASITATIATAKTIDGLSLPDLVVTVAAGATAVVGPFTPSTYEQTYDDGEDEWTKSILVDLSDDTTVEVAAIEVGA